MSIQVKAIAKGYFDHRIREEGDLFEINSKQELGSWMEECDEADGEELVKPKKGAKKKASDLSDGEDSVI